MDEENTERLVVVTSTPEGVAPLTLGERSMLEHEPGQVEQTAVVDTAYPNLLPGDPARDAFDRAKAAFADSSALEALRMARECARLQPAYLPAHVYEELAMNLARRRDLSACADKCQQTLELARKLESGEAIHPPTERPVRSEHIAELLDLVHYNLSDRLMRLGQYDQALEHLHRSQAMPKPLEAKMKRRIKEASLLFRLRDFEGSRIKLKQARDMDRELFLLMQERMAFDGHAGVEQPL